jgi:hypothetical protein
MTLTTPAGVYGASPRAVDPLDSRRGRLLHGAGQAYELEGELLEQMKREGAMAVEGRVRGRYPGVGLAASAFRTR